MIHAIRSCEPPGEPGVAQELLGPEQAALAGTAPKGSASHMDLAGAGKEGQRPLRRSLLLLG